MIYTTNKSQSFANTLITITVVYLSTFILEGQWFIQYLPLTAKWVLFRYSQFPTHGVYILQSSTDNDNIYKRKVSDLC